MTTEELCESRGRIAASVPWAVQPPNDVRGDDLKAWRRGFRAEKENPTVAEAMRAYPLFLKARREF